MIRRLATLLCLLGMLAGCEDSGISNVGRREMISAKKLVDMQGSSGAILVEIHGAPWPGADADAIAGTLRMPEGPGREVRFRTVPPGQGLIGDGERLVLHFNPQGTPDSARDCRARGELATGPPRKSGFIVQATFCRAESWLIHATFDADDVSPDDWLAYYLRMQDLLGTMFPDA